MTWTGVPWVIGGGDAEHGPEVSRLISYVAFNGQEGIVAPEDLAVTELAAPGAGGRVRAGSCSILNRAVGAEAEAYAGVNKGQNTFQINATGSSGRSDLVIAKIENPFAPGEPYSIPPDPRLGPYLFTRVIEGVDPNTISVHDLDLGYSAIDLARVDMPPNRTNMLNEHVVDLRYMNNALQRSFQESIQHGDFIETLTSSTYVDFPSNANITIRCPIWAVRADIDVTVRTVRSRSDDPTDGHNVFGNARVLTNGNADGQFSEWNQEWPSGATRFVSGHAETKNMLPHRGSNVTFQLQHRIQGGDGELEADNGTSVIFKVMFRQEPVWNF